MAKLKAALAADPRKDGAVEVAALPDGCARLVEHRSAGDVVRWELQRKVGRAWETAVTWDFDRGVRRPTTIGPFSMFTDLNQQGEWAGDQVHRKRFSRFAPDGGVTSTTLITHFHGQPVIQIETAEGKRTEASNRSERVCRNDGTGHCDNLQRDQFWYLEGTPY
ncbi:MAG: hypothetical protein IPJ65_28590 [Archangiaceae bacterium]|nr:hypothetical protein [Archangiaceae bacterium]